MKVKEHIEKAGGKTLFSFEILPPRKGEDINTLFNAIDPLLSFNPAFIDVTYHREEFVYKKLPNGLLKKHKTRKRPGTVGICAAVINKFGVDAVPHLICGGFSREETENALIDLGFLGIDNVLALQGDKLKTESSFVPHPEGNEYATDLIQQINNMNQGIYMDEDIDNKSAKTDFCIGIAGYPEKHFEAPNLKSDLYWLKKKVEMGAEYIVTQMFFDNQKYFDFVELCKSEGINVPIIPGLKPLATEKQLTILPSVFHIDIPEELVKSVKACNGDKQKIKDAGNEWCIQQSRELKAANVPALHYYTMSKSESTYKVAKAVF